MSANASAQRAHKSAKERFRVKIGKNQEPRKGRFSKEGFCRVQCHAEGNRKYPRISGPALQLELGAPQPRETYILAKTPLLKPPLPLVPELFENVLDTSDLQKDSHYFRGSSSPLSGI